ncbi:hypothetical protein R69776_06975 [Paraburkholderia nemoris]|uniref:EAL domain-containing protein n=1 Tax=Paraburkholderia nemoris TaxID=2793076 RepID=A0ABM8SX49_9BURK|nr:hypothetical protein R69776_06975 [Paraburkholderia nemoris]
MRQSGAAQASQHWHLDESVTNTSESLWCCVVVESVEDEEDLELSLACGAHSVQGYLFEPIFAAAFAQFTSDIRWD